MLRVANADPLLIRKDQGPMDMTCRKTLEALSKIVTERPEVSDCTQGSQMNGDSNWDGGDWRCG